MASGWALTQGSTTVTLPTPPKVTNDQNPADITVVKVQGAAPVLVGVDLDARTIRLEGSIYVSGQTNAQLETTYLAPIRSMARQLVTVTDPDGQFSGNWIMKEPDFKRDSEGAGVRYTYTITLLQGQSIVVL